jgi:hypothetical protein
MFIVCFWLLQLLIFLDFTFFLRKESASALLNKYVVRCLRSPPRGGVWEILASTKWRTARLAHSGFLLVLQVFDPSRQRLTHVVKDWSVFFLCITDSICQDNVVAIIRRFPHWSKYFDNATERHDFICWQIDSLISCVHFRWFTITYFVFVMHSWWNRLNYKTDDVMLTGTLVLPIMHNKNEKPNSTKSD